jgi:hypothetical protein
MNIRKANLKKLQEIELTKNKEHVRASRQLSRAACGSQVAN